MVSDRRQLVCTSIQFPAAYSGQSFSGDGAPGPSSAGHTSVGNHGWGVRPWQGAYIHTCPTGKSEIPLSVNTHQGEARFEPPIRNSYPVSLMSVCGDSNNEKAEWQSQTFSTVNESVAQYRERHVTGGGDWALIRRGRASKFRAHARDQKAW